ncbi:phytoene desaturase family protein [Paenibacillus glufosinatiresistens]|uniref:phytoene desaturase family protein n=1 Tax=Paenibacillus glufosinatiresistens TaxID=3070657 RepID=UPI00286D898A|nr:phytoene desaturase family protein [Paenibacillus sp. YX.27]
MRQRTAVVIGAGFGGLSCAVTLAARGWRVTVLERQDAPGGKLRRVEENGYRFDRGPSTITMPQAFAALYELAGERMEDHVELYELEPRTRNCFADGSVVDLSRDPERTAAQIALYSPQDALRYPAFLREAEKLSRLSQRRFLNRGPLSLRDKLSPGMIRDLVRVRPLVRLDTLLRRYFSHPNTLAMFGRYATYVGSSPYRAPSIFAMLGYTEAGEGVFGVRGGTYRLIEALTGLAERLGVTLLTGTEASSLAVRGGRVTGVETAGGFHGADAVICGGDALSVSRMLLPERSRPSLSDRKIGALEPSLSGMAILAGVRRTYEELLHHTVFFPADYRPEFEALFDTRTPPANPAVYVCHSGHSEPGLAPEGGSNLFILANAPALSPACDWEREAEAYGRRVLDTLEARGIGGLHGAEVLRRWTPQDIERDTLAHKGAIYGISSNTARQTFFRPGNRSAELPNLWYVGGTVHPGGGTPIVSLSGRLVGERIAQEALR